MKSERARRTRERVRNDGAKKATETLRLERRATTNNERNYSIPSEEMSVETVLTFDAVGQVVGFACGVVVVVLRW